MRRPIGAIAGIRRTVSGNKEVAKCVASSATEAVAWSIESASPVRWYGLITSNSPRSRLILQAVAPPCGGTEASCREKGTRFTAKSLAVTRLHPREGSTATVAVYDRSGRRLGTVYLGRMPEPGQKALSRQLTALLEGVLTRWTGPLPRLAYITDGGHHQTEYFRRVLKRMRHPRD